MTKQYAFYFDSSACSGCKACQVACKDVNDLEVGQLLRRVYEVVGGDWIPQGEAWGTNVFAYNLSIACNHCENPVCIEACATEAISKRDDGIVVIDAEKCDGYRRCAEACPYGAPQFIKEVEKSIKCDFCADYIDAGQAPACVAACPMRALDFGDLSELQTKYGTVNEVYPLPEAAATSPALIIKPHKDAVLSQNEPAYVANTEEI